MEGGRLSSDKKLNHRRDVSASATASRFSASRGLVTSSLRVERRMRTRFFAEYRQHRSWRDADCVLCGLWTWGPRTSGGEPEMPEWHADKIRLPSGRQQNLRSTGITVRVSCLIGGCCALDLPSSPLAMTNLLLSNSCCGSHPRKEWSITYLLDDR
jgi:hypothetical protein